MNAGEIWLKHLAIRSHFSSKTYDYHKYRGKVKVFKQLPAAHEWVYTAIRNKLTDKEIVPFFVLFCMQEPKMWAGEMLANIDQWWTQKKKLTRLHEIFVADLQTIIDFCIVNHIYLPDMFKSNNGNMANVIRLMQQGFICDETVCILDRSIKMLPPLLEEFRSNVIYAPILRRLQKYNGFILINNDRYEATLRDTLLGGCFLTDKFKETTDATV